MPLIDWTEYQIQSKDFVRVELLNFLSAYQTVANLVFRAEIESMGLLAGHLDLHFASAVPAVGLSCGFRTVKNTLGLLPGA